MCSKIELNQILTQVINIYKEIYKEDIYKVYLYGSYARDDFNSNSDIDIAAIVRGERKELQDRLKMVWDISADLELDYEVIISPTVIPYDEFMHYKDILPYYQNITQEGVELSA